jgi:hypothetical protein
MTDCVQASLHDRLRSRTVDIERLVALRGGKVGAITITPGRPYSDDLQNYGTCQKQS